MGVAVVWLKRDLRTIDHAPLAEAARSGPMIVLYVYEPCVLDQPEFHPQHLRFANDCLREVGARLRELGGRLTLRIGPMPNVLERLHRELESAGGIAGLFSHEETGTLATYERDKAVARWCASAGVRWREIPQHGVQRPSPGRDGWAARWQRRMREPITPEPTRLAPIDTLLSKLPSGKARPKFDHGRIMDARDLGIADEPPLRSQPGGMTRGRSLLESFLTDRGRLYRTQMSSPVVAFDACSRLSPHLAYGSVSIREAYQRAANARSEHNEAGDTRFAASVTSFLGRLRWHCHFIQKLEDQPDLERVNMSRAYDGLRVEDEADWTDRDRAQFEAYRAGQTGYPMVDACMRALHTGGWINFRMRAMLMSFASYHLWLHWRPTAIHLARLFVDYEPGIHYCQCQMQSGTTGINTPRIYSPTKQVIDHDPTGVFIREHVPELAGVPDEFIAEPWKMPGMTQHMAGCSIGEDYPEPIVNHANAYRRARDRLFAVRGTRQARSEAKRVYQKHGSRRPPRSRGRNEDRGGALDRAS